MANNTDNLSSFTHHRMFLSLLPILLMVTSSILLDYALRKESTISQRSQCQIWLWLAVALSWMQLDMKEEDDESLSAKFSVVLAWSNMTIFVNILVIVAETIQVNDIKSTMKPGKSSTAQEILQLTAISSWAVTVYTAIVLCTSGWEEKSVALSYAGLSLFGIVLMILLSIRWHVQRQERIRQETQGLAQASVLSPEIGKSTDLSRFLGPTYCVSKGMQPSMMVSSPVVSIDETQWYTWDRLQTLKWILRQFQTLSTTHAMSTVREHQEQREEREIVVSKLKSQRITGDVLDGLADVSKLILLQVPFGPACRLSRAIEHLIQQFPKPAASDQLIETMQSSGPCWLSQHDQEYNSLTVPSDQTITRTPQRLDDIPQHANDNVPRQDPIASESLRMNDTQTISKAEEERLNNLMKERFGIELPRIHSRTNSKAGGSAKPTPSARLSEDSQQSSTSSSPLQTVKTQDSSLISQDMLRQMPQHIQEIATRRPDLVAQLLKRKQHQLRQQASPMPQSKISMQSEFTARKAFQNRNGEVTNGTDDDIDENDDCDGDETTSLIPRDFNDSPVQYRSLEKTI